MAFCQLQILLKVGEEIGQNIEDGLTRAMKTPTDEAMPAMLKRWKSSGSALVEIVMMQLKNTCVHTRISRF